MATNITLETTTVDYEPAYPIDFSAGSNEKQNTAWPKIKLEVERIYRLINEANSFLNRCIKTIETAYNTLANEVEQKMSELGTLVNNTADEWRNSMFPVGTIVAFSGNRANIPSGWAVCDGTNGTPDLRGRFLQGADTSGSYINAGLPNIEGSIDVNAYCWSSVTGESDARCTGAFSSEFVSGTEREGISHGGGDPIYRVKFEAKKSNAIYGGSDTVQPSAYTVIYIMRIR